MKPRYTQLQILLEVLGFLLLAGMFLFLLLNWERFPEQIPLHYTLAGEIDRWGGKGELLLLPIAGLVLYALLTVVSLFPGIWNLPAEVTEKNRLPVMRSVRTLLLLLKAELTGIFLLLLFCQASAAALPIGFTLAGLALFFGTIAAALVHTVRLSRKQ